MSAPRMGRRGSVSVTVAVSFVGLLLTAGLALDGGRAWLLRNRLQQAVDAAALLAAYEIGASTQTADAQALFWVNYSSNAAGTGAGFLGSTSSGATVTTVDTVHVQVSAQATLPTTFMALGGVTTLTPAATAIAAKGTGYEIALALDITGSMLNSSGSGTTKAQALQTAAADMLDVIYGTADTATNLSVSVVPFRGSVNMGTPHSGWLNATAYNAANWTLQAWRGCVEARTGGYDITEDNPGAKSFNPLYWKSTYQTAPNTDTSSTTDYYYGDNDWRIGFVTDTGNGATSAASLGTYGGLPMGPNLGCSNSPVLPLTASKATVKGAISNMVSASGGSTVIAQGLQWAWFTLSPVWQGYWGLSNAGTGAARPLAYKAPNNQKIVILMSDGSNEWDGNEQTSQNLGCRYAKVVPECAQADGYYNSFGRLSENRLGIAMPASSSTASGNAVASNTASGLVAAALDTRTLKVCSAMKAQGIIIYTIAFQATSGSDAENLMKTCATDGAHYYNTNTGADIDSAFTSIGQQIISLRLTQ